MMRLIILSLLLLVSACQDSSHAQSTLPNQPAMAEEDASGTRVMLGWSVAEPTATDMKERQVPDDRSFAGAELWMQSVKQTKPDAATRHAFTEAGMQSVRLVAETALSPDAIDVLDSHESAKGFAFMVEGEIDGKPSYGIAISLYGSTDGTPRKTGVHAFMAPKEAFAALGGFAIVATKWFQASASPGEDMRTEGSLAPQAATHRLALFFNEWVEAYLIPMMGMSMQIQMQSIQNMQSWNNSMNACAGDPGCNVVPMNDGSGNWTTQTQ